MSCAFIAIGTATLDFTTQALPCRGMIRQTRILSLLAASTLTFSLAFAPLAAKPVDPPQAGGAAMGGFGFDVSGMDRAVDPGDDFYLYTNGGWNARTEIPADQARWGAFNQLLNESEVQVRDVLETAAATPSATGAARQAGDLYASFMDEATIEAKGAAPLTSDLARVTSIRGAQDISALIGWLCRSGGRGALSPVKLRVGVDDRNPDAYSLELGQATLGLPDRDYYLDAKNPRFAAARSAYADHVGKMLTLAGLPGGQEKGAAVLALETQIAKVMWSREQRRDPDKTYNPTPTAELAQRYPGIDWAALLDAVNLQTHATTIVGEPSAVKDLAAMVPTVPIDTWRAYFAYSLLSARAGVLPKAFVDEDFAFAKVLSGVAVQRDRWKRGVGFVAGGLGEAAGQLYVAKYFPPETKAKADALVRNLLAAFRVRLQKLTWMAPETKVKAIAKIDAFRPKIGYPDKWIDYSSVQIARDDAYGNLVRTLEFGFDRNAKRIDRPTDRGDWGMTPQTVNAYANPSWVEIVFPAAILRPPFFDPKADDAVNYGGIGAVIGHEISHHFDDQGRKYDFKGRLLPWWTKEDETRFKAYTDRVVAQYSAYEPLPGVHVKGENTLGENMADLAGLNVAHDAWLISLKGKKPPVIGGFTGEQRFFLGFAQVWRTKFRDAALQRALASDEHTPGMYRPYVVRNLDAWYAAFGVKPGTKFYLPLADRIKVW
jgi:putative endopeptidase